MPPIFLDFLKRHSIPHYNFDHAIPYHNLSYYYKPSPGEVSAYLIFLFPHSCFLSSVRLVNHQASLRAFCVRLLCFQFLIVFLFPYFKMCLFSVCLAGPANPGQRLPVTFRSAAAFLDIYLERIDAQRIVRLKTWPLYLC